MLILLVVPVVVAVALVHRLIEAVAPSNLLVRRVRSARPSGRVAAALLGLAAVLFLTMHVVANAVSAGAPGWLNLLVLLVAWDAIKVVWLGADVVLRGAKNRRIADAFCAVVWPTRGNDLASPATHTGEDTSDLHDRALRSRRRCGGRGSVTFARRARR